MQHIQGDTLSFVVSVKSGGVAINLTGATVRYRLSRSISEQALIDTICTIIDAPGGKVQVLCLPSEMTIPTGQYLWEVQITSSGGQVTTTPMQKITINPQLGTT